MEKTLKVHLQDQQNKFARLLAKHAVLIEGQWYVPGQVALDVVSDRITE